MWEVGFVLTSFEKLIVDGIDKHNTEDAATEVQTVYGVSERVLRLFLCNFIGLWKYDTRQVSFCVTWNIILEANHSWIRNHVVALEGLFLVIF